MDSAKKNPRVPLNFRISQDRIDSYDALASTYHLDRATVIRVHLAVAEQHKDEVRKQLARISEAQ